MIFTSLSDLLVLALAAAAVSLTLTRSQLTRRWRRWVLGKLPLMLDELMACPYCMAHWVAAVLALLVSDSWLLWLVHTAALTGLSAFLIGLLLKVWLYQEAELDELREALKGLILASERQQQQ